MKNLVISGSVSHFNNYLRLINELKPEYNVIDYPKQIDTNNFNELYPEIHKNFYKNITSANCFLLFNEDKKGITGYVGAAGFAELSFAIIQNLNYNKNIDVFIYKMPDVNVMCYDEIKRWLELGWIKLWENK